MREYMGLFRGKRTNNGEWVEGGLYEEKRMHESYFLIVRTAVDLRKEEYGHVPAEFFLVDPDSIGECTTLKDKNGKLIFEGDILKGMRGLHRVYYDTSLACFEWAKINGNWEESFSGFADEYEIIGNIHDNPELLEGAGE